MLPSLELPKYDVTLPVSNKKFKFRPFTVKEEKNLLIAMQDDNPDLTMSMIEETVKACTFNTIESFAGYAQLDMEYLFLQIRNKSMGEGVEVNATCTECGKKTVISIDLSKVGMEKKQEKVNPEVQLDEKLWLVMHYPSLHDTYRLNPESKDEEVLQVIANCVEQIVMGEQSYNTMDNTKEELVDWLSKLSSKQFNKIIEYFESAPKLVYETDYSCVHCKEKNHIRLEGLQDFFA